MARSAFSHSNDSQQLLQDIEGRRRQGRHRLPDHARVFRVDPGPSQASKIAANHTERFLPSIRNRALEMDEMLRYAVLARNALAADSVELMRSITELTSLSTTLKSQINLVNEEDDVTHFDYLRLIQQIPYVLRLLRRRGRQASRVVREGQDGLGHPGQRDGPLPGRGDQGGGGGGRKSVATLAYGPDSPGADKQVPGLEVNLLGEQEECAHTSKKELEDYYDVLQRQNADPELIEDIAKLVAELSSPTKQQSKRIKAFKNGSVHEAALGRSGLLIRGDDDVLRSLQDDKGRLENKLKTAESRVRRLEDLLHRQSQASRPTIGNLFQPSSQQQLSEKVDSTISVKSPRRPSNDRRTSSEGVELRLLQRISSWRVSSALKRSAQPSSRRT